MKTKALSDLRKYRLVHFGVTDAVVGRDITAMPRDVNVARLQASGNNVSLSSVEELPLAPFVTVKEELPDSAVSCDALKQELHSRISLKEELPDSAVSCDALKQELHSRISLKAGTSRELHLVAPEVTVRHGLNDLQTGCSSTDSTCNNRPTNLSTITECIAEDVKTSKDALCMTSSLASVELVVCERLKVEPIACPQCECVCYSEDEFLGHTESVHTTSKLQNFSKSNSSSIRKEYRTLDSKHSCKVEFQCCRCEFSFTDRRLLDQHTMAKHSGAQPFQCSQCDYSTEQKLNFKRHVLAKHSSEKPFRCSECSYSSAYKIDFQRHSMLKHSDKPPFQCTQCVYVSAHSSNFKRHMMVRHSGQKPFQCSKCQFSSADKSHLKKHTILKHSDIRPIECSLCEFSSIYRESIRNHMISKH
ncbi:Zinc finger C2H2-type [Trinorchestia longiramus]|nr:Zinc finger C2H2-type [Trinorchestia longiramus]